MKSIEVSDGVYDALKKMTTDFHQSPDDVLANLLNLRLSPAVANEPLVTYMLGAEFRAKFTDADKYLAILGWVATKHASDFNEFILSLASGRRYLGWSREEIVQQCRHNQARQIPDTHYLGDHEYRHRHEAPFSGARPRICRLPRRNHRARLQRHRHARPPPAPGRAAVNSPRA